MFTRECPECGVVVEHTNKYNRDEAVRRGRGCVPCGRKRAAKNHSGENNHFYGKTHSEESIAKMSEATKKQWQRMSESERERHLSNLELGRGSNRTVEEAWRDKYGDEAEDMLQKLYRERSSPGEKNGMYGKPSPQGSGNGWSGWLDGVYFRSLHELQALIHLEGQDYEIAETNAYKVEWTDSKGQKRNYFPDFAVGDEIWEVKPKRLWESGRVKRRAEAARSHFDEAGLSYRLVDFGKPSESSIMKLYESGRLVWQDRYQEKFEERYLNESEVDTN